MLVQNYLPADVVALLDLRQLRIEIRKGQRIAHELAHQWFGDSVSLATCQDLWLNEGFATYFQYLGQAHSEGAGALT